MLILLWWRADLISGIWHPVSELCTLTYNGDVSQISALCSGVQQVPNPADEFSCFRFTNYLPDTGLTPLQVSVQAWKPTLFGFGLGLLMVEQVDQKHADAELEALGTSPPRLRHQPPAWREQKSGSEKDPTDDGH